MPTSRIQPQRTTLALLALMFVWAPTTSRAGFPDIVSPLRTGQKAPKDAAIIISLETYPFLRQGVPYAHRDGDAMEHLLLYTYGVGPRRVFRVRAGDRGHLLQQVRQAAKAVKPGGTLWFYFAGHGANRSGQHYLVADDARDQVGRFFEKSVSEAEIKAALAGSRANQVVYIEDSCFGATEALRTAGPADPVRRPKMIHLSATSSGAMAKPLREAKHGAFTYVLVGALRGWADGEFDDQRDGQVTLAEAKRYVQRELTGLGVEQRPVFVADSDSDQILSRGAKEAPPFRRAKSNRPQPATPANGYVEVSRALNGYRTVKPEGADVRAKAQEAHLAALTQQWNAVRDALLAGRDPGMKALRVFLDAYQDHPLGNPYGRDGRQLLDQMEATSIEWIDVAGGSFMMGSTDGADDERPVREVKVRSFAIAKHEVTVAQYETCVNAGACAKPDPRYSACNWQHGDRADHPMNCVSWAEARAFATWIGAQIPSEAQWEFAARGAGQRVTYPWGHAEVTCARAVVVGCGEKTTARVCSRRLGTGRLGVCDMSGNVWEWVEDWYGPYQDAPINGDARLVAPKAALEPRGTRLSRRARLKARSAPGRVLRGGGFNSRSHHARVANRTWDSPDRRKPGIGFRVVRQAK